MGGVGSPARAAVDCSYCPCRFAGRIETALRGGLCLLGGGLDNQPLCRRLQPVLPGSEGHSVQMAGPAKTGRSPLSSGLRMVFEAQRDCGSHQRIVGAVLDDGRRCRCQDVGQSGPYLSTRFVHEIIQDGTHEISEPNQSARDSATAVDAPATGRGIGYPHSGPTCRICHNVCRRTGSLDIRHAPRRLSWSPRP